MTNIMSNHDNKYLEIIENLLKENINLKNKINVSEIDTNNVINNETINSKKKK
jgi:hypothetical protein